MDIIETLKKHGIEVTPEIEKDLGGDFISRQEHEKKIGKVEMERDKYKADFEDAKDTLSSYEGKDFDQLTADRDEWRKKYEESEANYIEKIMQRDRADAIKELSKDLKFTSASARKSFLNDLEGSNLPFENGKLMGFNDFVEDYKTRDKDAFVDDSQQSLEQNKAQITSSINSDGKRGALTKKDILAITDRAERQQKIAENMHLFS